jgi:hypothetical protein
VQFQILSNPEFLAEGTGSGFISPWSNIDRWRLTEKKVKTSALLMCMLMGVRR